MKTRSDVFRKHIIDGEEYDFSQVSELIRFMLHAVEEMEKKPWFKFNLRTFGDNEGETILNFNPKICIGCVATASLFILSETNKPGLIINHRLRANLFEMDLSVMQLLESLFDQLRAGFINQSSYDPLNTWETVYRTKDFKQIDYTYKPNAWKKEMNKLMKYHLENKTTIK